MNKKIIYIKYNSYRKPEFNLRTEFRIENKKKYVYKVALYEQGKSFIQYINNSYKQLSRLNLPLKVNKCTLIDESTLRFDYIKGETLLDELKRETKKHNSRSFIQKCEDFKNLLDQLPSQTGKLSKNFEKVFGSYEDNTKYDLLLPGILDLNLDNIIRDTKGELYLIDYEWYFDFGIPKKYILFRSISNLFISAKLIDTESFNIDKIFSLFQINKEDIDKYLNWELNFQGYVSKEELQKQQLTIYEISKSGDQLKEDTIITTKSDVNYQQKLLNNEINKPRSEYNQLQSEYNKLQDEYDQVKQQAQEFNNFKQTNIWKILKSWEKFKKYFRNFFINIRRDGFKLTFKRIFTRINNFIKYKKKQKYEKNRYKYWVKNHKITPAKRNKILKEIKDLPYQPLISIIMPVYNVDVKYLKEAVKSVKKQIYTNWELCIADDASTNKDLRNYLQKISKQKKIEVTFRSKNGHISECSNSALKLAKGEFIVLLDDDDIIYPHALAEIVKLLNKKRKTDLIYSDEDKLEMNGKRTEPFFKPDWSPDLFLSINYLCHLVAIRKTLVDDVGWFRKGYEGSQDYDLLLRVTEKTNNIEHIPDVLYSWRKIPGSTAAVYDNKGYADRNALKSLRDAVKRRNLDAVVTKGLFPGSFRVKYNIKDNPMVSIIIPTKDKVHYLQRCILSILEKTTYDNYEIIIVDTGSKEKDTFNFYKILKTSPRIRFLHWKKDFNYSSVNNFGVKNAKGEFLLLLNNDTEVITSNWIENMLEHAQREKIGAVGVKLLYPNNTIQHAGVILGINGGEGRGVAGHAFKYFPAKVQGLPVLKDVIRNYSAVTAACLMIRKDKFNSVKGLNKEFRIAFNDVDFCLKLSKKGFYNLYTPYTELYHHESISVGTPDKGTRDVKEFRKEIDLMWKRWEKEIANDPFYNKNLSLSTEDFSIKIK